MSSYFKIAQFESLAAQLNGYSLVDHLLPAINESVPVINITRRRSLQSIEVIGLNPDDLSVLEREETTDSAGQPLRLEALGGQEVDINLKAAEALQAAPGDSLELYVSSKPKVFTVRGIAAQGENPRRPFKPSPGAGVVQSKRQDQPDHCLKSR